MRFNDLLHLIAIAPGLHSLGRRMGDLRRPVSTQPRCRIPVRFPIPQTNFSPYIPLSAPHWRGPSGFSFSHFPSVLCPARTGGHTPLSLPAGQWHLELFRPPKAVPSFGAASGIQKLLVYANVPLAVLPRFPAPPSQGQAFRGKKGTLKLQCDGPINTRCTYSGGKAGYDILLQQSTVGACGTWPV